MCIVGNFKGNIIVVYVLIIFNVDCYFSFGVDMFEDVFCNCDFGDDIGVFY